MQGPQLQENSENHIDKPESVEENGWLDRTAKPNAMKMGTENINLQYKNNFESF